MLPLLESNAGIEGNAFEANAVPLSDEEPNSNNRFLSAPVALIKFNLRIAFKRGKLKQVLAPIFFNILFICIMRMGSPDGTLPPARFLNEIDPVRECVPRDISVSFYCEQEHNSDCDAIFEKFRVHLMKARLEPVKYTDQPEYESSLRFETRSVGARVLSPTSIELDMDQERFDNFSKLEDSSRVTCHTLSDPTCAPMSFFRSCVGAVEAAALKAMNISSGHTKEIKFRIFPQQRTVISGIADTSLSWIIPLYLSGLFLNLFNFALIELVSEKEGRHRDYLLAWGITKLDHFMSWLVTNSLFGLLAVSLMVHLLINGDVFSEEFANILFVGFLSYLIALLSIAYLVSTKISSVRTASNLASLTDIVFNVATVSAGAIHNRVISILLAAIPTVPFFILIRSIALEQAHATSNISSLTALGISLINTGCIIAIALYSLRTDLVTNEEPSDVSGNLVASVRNLTKRYPDAETNALTNVSLDLYPGEVHCLIGANGAGKSTLINTILRIQVPTNCDFFSVPSSDRVALCLQDDAFWELMTVRNHIQFFAKELAGISEPEINQLTLRLGLEEVIDQQCTTLSGGQKRRLSVLLAVAKARRRSTQLIIFDEPTTGIDVEGRRVVWELIREISSRSAVLLTTHYLDEAQALSDRVTFLAEGKVKASGTMTELQSSFHGGYLLTVRRKDVHFVRPMAEKLSIYPESTDSVVFRFPVGSEASAIDVMKLLPPDSVTFESVSLDNMFTELSRTEEANVGEIPEMSEYQGVTEKASWTSQVLAMTRVRVKPKISNPSSIFSNIVLPIILISFSLIARNVGFSFARPVPNVAPQLYVEDQGNLVNAFNGTSDDVVVRVPIAGDWSGMPLPSMFEPFLIPKETDMMDYLWEAHEWYPFALDFRPSGGKIEVWLNPTSPKSPLALLAFFETDSAVSIRTGTLFSETEFNAIIKSSVINIVVYVVISLSVIATQCATQIFDERRSLIKRLSQIQGLQPSAYWSGSVLGHVCLNLPVLLMAPVTAIITLGPVISEVPGSWTVLCVSAIVNSAQLVLFGYMFSMLFKSKENLLKYNSLYSLVMYEAIVIGGVTVILTFYRTSFPSIIFWLSIFVPPFNIAAVIAQLAAMHMSSCSIIYGTCYWDQSVWSAGVWIPILAGLVQATAVGLFLVVTERRDQQRLTNPTLKDCAWAMSPPGTSDSSVEAETERVMKGCDDNVLFVKLWHTYPPDPSSAGSTDTQWVVRDLTFGVQPNETLALLGRNGAGKTTALSTLLGLNRQVAGYAGVWPGKSIGFCPQINSLWDGLSGLDHIRFYASLRGCWVGNHYGESILKRVGLDDIYKRSKSYSGGMKRRLCIAIALVGNPEVIILDEPTAGVDVGGKREIWDILNSLRNSCSVIVTTHSLEEADMLASRVAIMERGRLVQVGTPYSLKSSQKRLRLSFEVRLTDDMFDVFLTKLSSGEDGVTRISDHDIEIDLRNLAVWNVVQVCHDLRATGVCGHFTINQLSLEDIFLKTVNQQQ